MGARLEHLGLRAPTGPKPNMTELTRRRGRARAPNVVATPREEKNQTPREAMGLRSSKKHELNLSFQHTGATAAAQYLIRTPSKQTGNKKAGESGGGTEKIGKESLRRFYTVRKQTNLAQAETISQCQVVRSHNKVRGELVQSNGRGYQKNEKTNEAT